MRIQDRLLQTQPCFSFEFFPPRDETALRSLYETISELASLKPGFVSVTYGAGGRTRGRTVEIASHIKNELKIEAMAHLTCTGHSRKEIEEVLQRLAHEGIENVLAMRGDPPKGEPFIPNPQGFAYANQLVSFIRSQKHSFCLGGACYPEVHPEAKSAEEDLHYLRNKVDAGLDFLITQLFFDNQVFFDFLRRTKESGITVPIVPGIMPVVSIEQLERVIKMGGDAVPSSLREGLEKWRGNAQASLEVGVAHAAAQCIELLQQGVRAIHFYTFNRSPATRKVIQAIQKAI